MASEDGRSLTPASNLPPHSTQLSFTVEELSHEIEQVLMSEKGSDENPSRHVKVEMSPSIYVTVHQISEGHASYGVTTMPCQDKDMELMEAEPHDGDSIVIASKSEYNKTTHQGAEFDKTDELLLEESEGDFWTDACLDTEYYYSSYKDLLACNGSFTLPLDNLIGFIDGETWLTTATICDEDQDALHAALAETSWI
ncbi:hypothetical protein ONS95_003730 [Cadophora gregata]|uniref:uncharacterized protein n=1 Tax=Cadophora gregata TaxID=51156 RepID=UPI0026DD4076|nr:uncharacterized protein ONS95_003730 [Cadophora gregata]KAK0107016.1 hypothetical protein ONS95_003730 [Cadophora gregata]